MMKKKRGGFGDISIYKNFHLGGILRTKSSKNRFSLHSFLQNKVAWMILVVSVLAVTSGVTIAKAVEVQKMAVTLNNDGKIVSVTTMKKTVGALLSEYGIVIQTGDELKPSAEEELKDGESIEIIRAIPISILADQKRNTVFLVRGTVKDALDKAGIRVLDEDIVNPGLDEKLTTGMNIQIIRTEVKTIVEKTPIPFKVVLKKDNQILAGQEQVTRNGALGERQKSIQVKIQEDVEISREVISEVVTKMPVNKVIVRGTRSIQTVSRSVGTRQQHTIVPPARKSTVAVASARKSTVVPVTKSTVVPVTSGKMGDTEYKEVRVMAATAYTYTGNTTATGQRTARGIIAVDPSVIPLGTRLYVEGYGYGIAQDTGGVINGNIIDLFMESNAECIRWGRKTVRVFILK